MKGNCSHKVYEETPDVQKQAFVREEISVRKEVEQVTVEVEDKIRRELDLDIKMLNRRNQDVVTTADPFSKCWKNKFQCRFFCRITKWR